MRISSVSLGLLLLCGSFAGRALANDGGSTQISAVPIQCVVIDDTFWSPRRKVWREVTIPDCFNKFENDRGGALNNFDRVRDGKTDGHAGPPWYDGLIYEMIRGASDFLAAQRDPALEKRIDGYIERIAAAQQKDPNGYLNTWTQLEHPERRWGLNGGNDGYQHEMYNVGGACEAGLHYYQATGKSGLLKVAIKMANFTCDQIGPAPKYELVPNHAIVEESFADLYRFFRAHPEVKRELGLPVDEMRYLQLARYWIEARGHPRKDQPSYGAYNQDHKPVLEQTAIEGHAVRAALLGSGLTALAQINGNDGYRRAAIRLWENMTGRKSYVTGGIGATANGEAFGGDYILPNDGYLETCGAVGAAFFSQNLNVLTGDARYVDVLERELYNGALAGISLAGNSYTYVNPLEAPRGNARWSWHTCPCCPPMVLKLMGAMPRYIYATDGDGLYVNLFVGSKANVGFGGHHLRLSQTTDYPWQGRVTLRVDQTDKKPFDLHIRIPGWARADADPDALYAPAGRLTVKPPEFRLNGTPLERVPVDRGYAKIQRAWKKGDVVELTLDMPVQPLKANARVEADKGRLAWTRGPLVYCFEAADNGGAVGNLVLSSDTTLLPKFRQDFLGGIMTLSGKAKGVFQTSEKKKEDIPFAITAIPYFANANRGACEMQVWMAESAESARPQRQE